jgi:hypothetical protein
MKREIYCCVEARNWPLIEVRSWKERRDNCCFLLNNLITYKLFVSVIYDQIGAVCTAQWSLYVPHSGHYMYRKAVTICTAQRSLYVPHRGHYMYRKAVTIRTVQRSLYVPYSGHYMYHTAVTIRTTSLTFSNSTFCPHSCIYVFCVDLRTNSDYFPIQHWLTGLYNRGGVCLLRGTDCI